jgi:tripartite-type tricarboxylate transporter receptor subunit TctC
MNTRNFLKALALGAALAAGAGPALAQSYPARPVRMIVPFPAGSATDMAARVIGQQLSTTLGQAFVIDNKPGAEGTIAAMEVVRAAPDGYTLLFSSNSAIASNVALVKNMQYDPLKDFTPVSGIAETMLALMVKTDHPAKNVQDLVKYVKSRPGKVTAGYGSSSSQISIAVLNKLAGIDTLSVPYKGIPLAINDTLGGTVDYTFADLGNAMAQVKGGRMRALGITSAKRSPLVPDWAPIADTLPGFNITAWFAVVGPNNLPKDVVAKLDGAIADALQRPDVKERLASIGMQPMHLKPEELRTFMGNEVGNWSRLAKQANIEPQ